MNILKFALLVATHDFKNRPVLQTRKYRPVKRIQRRVQGGCGISGTIEGLLLRG